MSIPLIWRIATTQDAAASPSVAVSAVPVAVVLALVMAAERGSLRATLRQLSAMDCDMAWGWRVPAYTRVAPLRKASSTSACPMPRLAPVTRTALSAIGHRGASSADRREGENARRTHAF
ncbi:MAG: hypothetical protein ACXWNK_15550 [Vulcanimicrobiaceae bacterium]